MRIWFSGCSVATILILLVAGTGFSGCASSPSPGEAKRMQALQRKLKRQSARLQDLKERNLVLEKRRTQRQSTQASEPVIDLNSETELGVSIADAPVPAKSVAPKIEATKPIAPISVSPEKTGEHYLYSKILETYRARNSREMETTLGLLLKSYPESEFADNALYLSGLMAFENGDLNGSKLKFDRLLRDFPRSNKAVAALFAKASIERKLGRSGEAKRSYIQVRTLFPGSPEAARVAVELKLLESASLKKQEM